MDTIGTLDHLAVTASPGSRVSFLESSVEEAHSYMEGKFWSTYRAAWHAAKKMNKNGSMLFITGGLATKPSKGSAMVTSAFNAVEGFSKALAVELAPIRVNTIRPGLFDTPMWNFMDQDTKAKFFAEVSAKTPVPRPGVPDDIGQLATMLMTNTFITGTVIDLNGGAHLV